MPESSEFFFSSQHILWSLNGSLVQNVANWWSTQNVQNYCLFMMFEKLLGHCTSVLCFGLKCSFFKMFYIQKLIWISLLFYFILFWISRFFISPSNCCILGAWYAVKYLPFCFLHSLLGMSFKVSLRVGSFVSQYQDVLSSLYTQHITYYYLTVLCICLLCLSTKQCAPNLLLHN